MGKYHNTAEILGMMGNLEQLRNVGLVGHIDHGKTTLSDSLLAEAGLLSESLVGEARALDYLEEEQRRGITMKSANVSLYFEHAFNDKDKDVPFIINLVDTPGHLDFSGKVSRALRLIDGVIIIVDAVEELNSQSEIVLKQALEENVKPILFINKIDRLFRELKLTNDEIKEKFNRIIIKFNLLINRFADNEEREKWKVSARDGSVIFGSALHKWGFTIPKILKMGWSFQNISEKYENDEFEDLLQIFPVWKAVLSMIILHLPNPREAQKYRIKKIWGGNFESNLGKYMLNCDPNGPLIMCMSNIKYDSHGLIATGRIFSGTLTKGKKVYLIDADSEERVLQVALFMGARMDNVNSIPAGNIAAVGGLKAVRSGETLVTSKIQSEEKMTSFESVKYVSSPVVTIGIEPEMLKELNNLQTYLDQILIEDPNLRYNISKDTGEVLLSGMGPLHLEIAGKEIEKKGINVTFSKPMSVFRESIAGQSESITVKSPENKNEITLTIERNDLKTINFIRTLKFSAFSSYNQIIKSLKENTTLNEKEANGYLYSDEYGNLVINAVKDLRIERYNGKKEYLRKKKEKKSRRGKSKTSSENMMYIKDTTIENIISATRNIFLSGPLCSERLAELKIIIEDLRLSKDIIDEENLSDIAPLLREAIFKAISDAGSIILEPIYELIIKAPIEQLGKITNLLAHFQAKIRNVEQHDEYSTEITAHMSVREYINFTKEIRSKSSGRAFWQAQFHSFEHVPENRKEMILQEIKFRKGQFFL
ncbi:MAG: GTP-binding protein [Promethearchaeota archaeon]